MQAHIVKAIYFWTQQMMFSRLILRTEASKQKERLKWMFDVNISILEVNASGSCSKYQTCVIGRMCVFKGDLEGEGVEN